MASRILTKNSFFFSISCSQTPVEIQGFSFLPEKINMISLDTETTGLWFKHGCQVFAVGIYDGETDYTANVLVDPLTRQRKRDFRQGTLKNIKDKFFNADLVCMHNSNFDLKGLVDLGIIHASDPGRPEFWDRIMDTTILSHLHHNTDKRSLKELSRQYLDVDYTEETELDDIVKMCRNYVRSKFPHWCIAENTPRHKTLIPAGKSSSWFKMDMWLPELLFETTPKQALHEYFNRDKNKPFNIDKLRTVLINYLKADCRYTYELAETMMANVLDVHGDKTEELLNINNQIRHIIWKMENTGIVLHSRELKDAVNVCEESIKAYHSKCSEISGLTDFTPNNLKELLYRQWEIPCPKKTKKGNESTDAKVLIDLKTECDENEFAQGSEFLAYLMALRKTTKKLEYIQSYIRASKATDNKTLYIYPSVNCVGTDTLRLSSNDPNEQNISKTQNPFEDSFADVSALMENSPHLRSLFGPPDGFWWLSNDYSQLQLRIFAVVTNEEEMIDKLNKGYDAHDITARRIFGIPDSQQPSKLQRRIAKNVNFGFIFGASPKKIEQTAGVAGLWDTVTEMFPNAHAFIEQIKHEIKGNDYVRTLGGYPLDVPLRLNEWRGTMEKAAHAAVCYIIQGSEGVIVKRAMRYCDDYLSQYYPQGRIAMQVHDEINFELPTKFPKKHARELKSQMERAAEEYGVYAPVNSEVIFRNWSNGKELIL